MILHQSNPPVPIPVPCATLGHEGLENTVDVVHRLSKDQKQPTQQIL